MYLHVRIVNIRWYQNGSGWNLINNKGIKEWFIDFLIAPRDVVLEEKEVEPIYGDFQFILYYKQKLTQRIRHEKRILYDVKSGIGRSSLTNKDCLNFKRQRDELSSKYVTICL